MSTVATLLIIAANCVVLYFSSFLAAGGDGSAQGVWTVQIIGFAWIALASSLALHKCSKGHGSTGVTIAISTLPVALLAGYAVGLVLVAGEGALSLVEPTPAEVTETCKSGGPKYLVSPVTPIHSIAFDWKTSTERSRFSYVNKEPRKFGKFQFLDQVVYPQSIHFIESKFQSGLGVQTEEHWPYMRMPNGGVFVGVKELTADALVTYEITALSKANAKNVFELTDISVSDRRSGQVLASLRYPTDGHNSPVCGETSPGEVNIAEFIFKAIGTLPK